MRILIASVGRSRPAPHRTLFEHYRARLSWPVQIQEVTLPHALPADQQKEREGTLLLDCIPKDSIVVALDERGHRLSSAAFARTLGTWRDEGRRDIAFLIGGAEGLAEGVRQRANLVLSLGEMTWPHQLVPALLAEQLYRAETILSGHPYHRE